MPPRCSSSEVKAVLPDLVEGASVAAHINTAAVLVDRIAVKDTGSVMSVSALKQVEIYLAAHFAALRDPQYQVKSTGKASATFQGQTGLGLDLTWWGQQAKLLDFTGLLARMDTDAKNPRSEIGLFWLGSQAGRGDKDYTRPS